MITEKDLQEAIAECQGVRNPKADTCIKLAAFLIIQREMFGKTEMPEAPAYSYAAPPITTENLQRYSGQDTVGEYGDSEFLQAIKDKDPADVWAVMDELMDTLHMVNERVYNGVMRKIDA